jgi:hypothetical protein
VPPQPPVLVDNVLLLTLVSVGYVYKKSPIATTIGDFIFYTTLYFFHEVIDVPKVLACGGGV